MSASAIVTSVFRSPDPSRDGRTVTVAEMLGRASRQLETNRAVQPVHRFMMAHVREQDLRRYRQEYQDTYKSRAGSGLPVRQLREYQTFLARLSAAVEAQQATVGQLRQEAEQERAKLRAAMARRKALGTVIERAQHEERKMDDKRLQQELDELALRRTRSTP